MPERPPAPRECANCGASIPRGARACPECGADERTGWRETSLYDGLELPGEDDRDDSTTHPSSREVNGLAWYWWAAGVLVLLLIGLTFLGLR